jgi:predicted DNA binding CopG/RHH family protein
VTELEKVNVQASVTKKKTAIQLMDERLRGSVPDSSPVKKIIENQREAKHENVHNDVPNTVHDNVHEIPESNGFTDNLQKNDVHANIHNDAHDYVQEKVNFNLAFGRALYDRAKIRAAEQGKNMTKYLNDLVRDDIMQTDYPENPKNKKGR